MNTNQLITVVLAIVLTGGRHRVRTQVLRPLLARRQRREACANEHGRFSSRIDGCYALKHARDRFIDPDKVAGSSKS